jgi:hypothetical protein
MHESDSILWPGRHGVQKLIVAVLNDPKISAERSNNKFRKSMLANIFCELTAIHKRCFSCITPVVVQWNRRHQKESAMSESKKDDELNPTVDEDVVEGHGIEEDDADDAAGLQSLTITGICV